MDNAPWHKKTKRLICDESLPEYADILKNVVFIKLPPYSPDLNPIEQVWRITRRENTHNTFFASISILEMTIDESFNSWAAPNDQLKSLCSFKATPHKDSAADAPSDFSSDCTEIPKAY